MVEIIDQQQRKMVLDPAGSFIVQAPAGSGKTELLTRRFLKLLAYADKNPEEILAITFTRKAAFEMQERVLNALRLAATLVEPEDEHAKETYLLAQAALKRNRELNWALLENPNRLRIMTFDSFCASLAKQMPRVTDNPEILYLKAVNDLLSQIDDDVAWAVDISNLLAHLDNRLSDVRDLLVKMLAQRDQWLNYVVLNKNESESKRKKILEEGLKAIFVDAVEKINLTVPAWFDGVGIEVLSGLGVEVSGCRSAEDEVVDWFMVCELLLTKAGEWRKKVTKAQGFTAPSSAANKAERELLAARKKRMEDLLVRLQEYEEFREALVEFKNAPPLQYDDKQWRLLTALLNLLPLAVADLKLVFKAAGEVDYIEVAQAAKDALGSFESPTEFALALDYRIHHLLIDEFQDTSISQFDLVAQLIEGWQEGDGHTLFCVGDPMQSIYRFRNAEVGLFLRAWHEGIAQIKLTSVTLATNFRSEKPIIDWVNNSFGQILPQHEDISKGAVSYKPFKCMAEFEVNSINKVKIHTQINADEEQEAKVVIDIVKNCQRENPAGSIAVLVRARTHLPAVIAAFKNSSLHFQAIEIDSLKTRAVVLDLLSLTKAYLHLADRIAWLAVLRAPWCGLTLQDLHVIAADKQSLTIWQRINDKDVGAGLSVEGQKRLAHVRNVFTVAFKYRGRKSLRDLVNLVWLDLNGPACVNGITDLQDAQIFLQLLAQLEEGGDIKDFAFLEERVNKLFASPDLQASNKLQVMTIHKAKGLEFDTVIIPGLQRLTPKQDTQLLMWLERPRTHLASDLILAPIKATEVKSYDPIYQYCWRESRLKNEHENKRLFYVAATRAKQQLHLVGNVNSSEDGEIKPPIKGSFLYMLWPLVEDEFLVESRRVDAATKITPEQKQNDCLKRLKLTKLSVQEEIILEQGKLSKHVKLVKQDKLLAHVGTVIHRILYQISVDGLSVWPNERIAVAKKYWQSALLELGILPAELEQAVLLIEKAINNTLIDEKGRWILTKHKEAKSEFAIATTENGELKRYIIDRTFIDEKNQRWIVDYKTGDLKSAKEKYAKQLKNYGRILAALYAETKVLGSSREDSLSASKQGGLNLKNEKIKFGLYFPLTADWLEF
jgi:ATP-dependent helicase/nuclease subunit A